MSNVQLEEILWHLSRQELADLTGTTFETGIRIMSRWGKDDIVKAALEELAATWRRASRHRDLHHTCGLSHDGGRVRRTK